jgi:NAD(P)H-dependent FMN reductase
MADKLNIQIIISSTRENRFGRTVGEWVHSVAASRDDINAELLDLRDYPMPFFEEPASPGGGHIADAAIPWAEKIEQGDGYIFVTAEYNHGPTAVLKNALDHIYHQWVRKPAGFVSYGGGAGGARAVEQLRLNIIELQMAPIRDAVVIPMGRSAFDENGQPKSADQTKYLNNMIDQLVWWADALKKAREAS